MFLTDNIENDRFAINTVKSLLPAHALIEAHSPVWTPKILNFQANLKKSSP